MPTPNLCFQDVRQKNYSMIVSEWIWLSQNQKPSYKTINRFRVNPKVDALLESLFIQFHSQCLKQNIIDDQAIFIDGTKVEANANRYTFVWKKVFTTMSQG